MLSCWVGLPAHPADSTCPPITLVAAKTYNPSTFFPALVQLPSPVSFALPAEIPVTQGNAGNHTTTFRYRLASNAEVRCTYKGGASTSHPTTPDQIQRGLKYKFSSCTITSLRAGTVVQADLLRLNVDNGDAVVGRTEVNLVIRPTVCQQQLGVQLTSPSAGSYEVGRVLPVAATLTNAGAGASVQFTANGTVFATDTSAPFEAGYLIPDPAGSSIALRAIATSSGVSVTSSPVTVTSSARPQPAPASARILSLYFSEATELGVAVDSDIRVELSEPIAPSSLAAGVRLLRDDVVVPVLVDLDLDGRTVIVRPTAALASETLYTVVIDGLTTTAGASSERRVRAFLTETSRAFLSGTILDGNGRPLEGIPVRLANRTTYTDAAGTFLLADVPTGEQHLHVDPAVIDDKSYPDLAFLVQIEPGLDRNGLGRPIFLPALDTTGGLDIVNGYPVLSTSLASSQVAGMALNLSGSRVFNQDGTPFTGRMSISRVPPENLPMPLPRIFSSTFVTVQPGGLLLVPPAPITYPNLDGAPPGEQVPLWHFDHDVGAWVTYGTATVSTDGTNFTSNAGQGLPKTGWGTPQPPMTFTTATGSVVDAEGNPLHGVLVQSGTAIGYTEDDGSFSLADVPSGRQGSPPPQISVRAVARDLEGLTFSSFSTLRTAVQNGTTPFGQIRIDGYAPLVAGKLHLHSDYRTVLPSPGGTSSPGGTASPGDKAAATFRNHELRRGSHSDQRYRTEVAWLQKGLRALGYRKNVPENATCNGRSSIMYDCNNGQPLPVDGTFGEDLERAVRLFKVYFFWGAYSSSGGSLPTDVNSGVVGRSTQSVFNQLVSFDGNFNAVVERRIWVNIPDQGFVDYAPAGDCGSRPEVGDDWGYADVANFLFTVQALTGSVDFAVNDVSIPGGDSFCPHHTHDIGLAVDIPLPTTSGGWGTNVGDGNYDRAKARAILRAAIDAGVSEDSFLDDSVLCAETYRGRSLCTVIGGHHNHFHFRVLPAPSVSAASAPLAPQSVPAIRSITVPGGSEGDVPLDAKSIVAPLAVALDPASLSGQLTVRGPGGPVAGTFAIDPGGLAVAFTPSGLLAPSTTFTFEIATGAVTEDGQPLLTPLSRTFTTEASDTLRLVQASPAAGTELVPIDTGISLRFDSPLDARTLTGTSAQLRTTTGATVPIALSLDATGTVLSVKAQPYLPYPASFLLDLAPSLRNTAGQALAGATNISNFSTDLPERVDSLVVSPRAVVFSRQNLVPVRLQVKALGSFPNGGTEIPLAPPFNPPSFNVVGTGLATDAAVVSIDRAGNLGLAGSNGVALIDVRTGSGSAGYVKVDVVDVFPSVTFVGPVQKQAPAAPVSLLFSERVDTTELRVDQVTLATELGLAVAGTSGISADGKTVTFTPTFDLDPGAGYTIGYRLTVTDPLGNSWSFNRGLAFRTGTQACATGLFTATGVTGAIQLEAFDEDLFTWVPVAPVVPGANGRFCLNLVRGLQYRIRDETFCDVNFSIPEDSNGSCSDGDTSDCEDLGTIDQLFCGS